jgi:hypothetical protein
VGSRAARPIVAAGYAEPVSLADLIAPARRVAVVGLAKNTGKTETLAALLRELEQAGRVVGVTSVGRDGEPRDVIDPHIEKPRVRLWTGSLLASTDALLRASGTRYEQLQDTGVRTPLGRVLLARLLAAGAIEIAGPSGALEVRAVADAMLACGAELVLVDGAIDRRAASSPAVCDALVIATGAILAEQIEDVVEQTRDAVELVRCPELADPSIRALAAARLTNLLIDREGPHVVELHPRFALTSTREDVARLLRENPEASHLVLRGALCEPFLQTLLLAARGRELTLVVADSTKVFLTNRGLSWYSRQGVSIRVLDSIRLSAITVNPVAPRSHSFESARLRELIEAAVPDVPVLDVRDAGGSAATLADVRAGAD